MLDAYFPDDSRDKVPAIVHMHGGGFSAGNKRNNSIVKYSHMMAMRGYAVFSISYRLTAGTDKAVFDAQEDFRAAIRYVRSQAEGFHLDTDRIIASGMSAGAITALTMAYVQEA